MKCTNCGIPLSSEDVFCPDCGTAVAEQEEKTLLPEVPSDAPAEGIEDEQPESVTPLPEETPLIEEKEEQQDTLEEEKEELSDTPSEEPIPPELSASPQWTPPPDPSKIAKRRKNIAILVALLLVLAFVFAGILFLRSRSKKEPEVVTSMVYQEKTSSDGLY